VVDHGNNVERGSPDELLKRGGTDAEINQRQRAGFTSSSVTCAFRHHSIGRTLTR
jgi:hypothetical protein